MNEKTRMYDEKKERKTCEQRKENTEYHEVKPENEKENVEKTNGRCKKEEKESS